MDEQHEKKLTDMTPDEIAVIRARQQEALQLLQQYKALLHSQRGRMLPLSPEAENSLNDQLAEIRRKAWEEYGVDLRKFL